LSHREGRLEGCDAPLKPLLDYLNFARWSAHARFDRLFAVIALLLMAGWSAMVTVAVVTDRQLTVDMAAGVVLAAVLLPVVLAACVLGLLVCPLIRLMDDDADKPDRDSALPSER